MPESAAKDLKTETPNQGENKMNMPRTQIKMQMDQAWNEFTSSLEKSIDMLEKDIDDASEMTDICTDEWCEATEHYIDDLNNALFSISEPRGSSQQASDKIKALKRRVYDLYANYREVYRKARA
jgi:hypothetical protein